MGSPNAEQRLRQLFADAPAQGEQIIASVQKLGREATVRGEILRGSRTTPLAHEAAELGGGIGEAARMGRAATIGLGGLGGLTQRAFYSVADRARSAAGERVRNEMVPALTSSGGAALMATIRRLQAVEAANTAARTTGRTIGRLGTRAAITAGRP